MGGDRVSSLGGSGVDVTPLGGIGVRAARRSEQGRWSLDGAPPHLLFQPAHNQFEPTAAFITTQAISQYYPSIKNDKGAFGFKRKNKEKAVLSWFVVPAPPHPPFSPNGPFSSPISVLIP